MRGPSKTQKDEKDEKDQKRFERVRQGWIDEGYANLQTEWFERGPEAAPEPNRYRVFAYWEDPDSAPSIDQLRRWGLQAPSLPLVK